jgi:hypothetical protein
MKTRIEAEDVLDDIVSELEKYPEEFWENGREVQYTEVKHSPTMDIPYCIMDDDVIVPFFNLVREYKS